MLRKTDLMRMALTLSLALLMIAAGTVGQGGANAGQEMAAAQAQRKCKPNTEEEKASLDAEIAKKIDDAIRDDALLSGQFDHIVPSVKNRNVKLFGFAISDDPEKKKRAIRRAKDIALGVECVKNVTTRELAPKPTGGCGTGMKPCGGVCIPTGDPCHRTG
jgi:osmotically-inducible protein OsmY